MLMMSSSRGSSRNNVLLAKRILTNSRHLSKILWLASDFFVIASNIDANIAGFQAALADGQNGFTRNLYATLQAASDMANGSWDAAPSASFPDTCKAVLPTRRPSRSDFNALLQTSRKETEKFYAMVQRTCSRTADTIS